MPFRLPDALRDAWTMPPAGGRAVRGDEPWRDFARRLRELLGVDPASHAAAVQTALAAGRYVVCAESTADAVLATITPPSLRH